MGNKAFEKTYELYLSQIREISPESVAQTLGAMVEGAVLRITLLGKDHEVSSRGIVDPRGNRPPHDICVILSKYVLLCPQETPKGEHWVTFREFKDSAPLVNYFTHDVELGTSSYFSGRLDELRNASKRLGGYPPAIHATYDFAAQFDALPRVPVMLLFNDADDEFPAESLVLFEARAEKYLDAECLAMLGWQLFCRLSEP